MSVDGPWYVYSAARRRFVKRARVNDGTHRDVPEGMYYITWSDKLKTAAAYMYPSNAKRLAARLNTQDFRMMCRAVDTQAARMLEELIRREEEKIRHL